jgi:hypothetical protein
MVGELKCVECGGTSGWRARGWKAIRCSDEEQDDPPELAFYCPLCAWAEFGIEVRRPPLNE